jgi:hypothetical protein
MAKIKIKKSGVYRYDCDVWCRIFAYLLCNDSTAKIPEALPGYPSSTVQTKLPESDLATLCR